MPTLVGMKFIDALKRLWHFFWAPCWVTLVLGLASLVASPYWQNVLVNAVTGQLALTLIKLFLYLSLILLGIAAVLKSVPYLATLFRWSGTRFADVTFDYTSATLGVFVGLLPAVMSDLGPTRGAILMGYLIFLMAGMLFVIWVGANLASSKFDVHLPAPNISVRLGGLALIVIAAASLGEEPWQEAQASQSECISEQKSSNAPVS
jgi:TRAP-type mannitol/chloroaromatic compound transport system permease small subunit